MSFLDKLKQQAGVAAQAAENAAQTAVNKTKTMAAIGRVKLAIASEEDKMKKAYTELGHLFYRDYEAQAEAAMEDYQPWCEKVADAKDQIARLNDELEKLRTEEPGDDLAEVSIEVDMTTKPEEAAPEAAPETEPETEREKATETAPETDETPAEPEPPTVGTLYVDETHTEE